MPRYFFHIIDGAFQPDSEGMLCASHDEMREQAITTAGAILKDMAGKFPAGVEWQMYVTDEAKKTVLKLRFSALEPV